MYEKYDETGEDGIVEFEYSALNAEERRRFEHFMSVPLNSRSFEVQETIIRLCAIKAGVQHKYADLVPGILEKPSENRTGEERELLYLVELMKRDLFQNRHVIEDEHPGFKELIQEFTNRLRLFPHINDDEHMYMKALNTNIRLIAEQIFQ